MMDIVDLEYIAEKVNQSRREKLMKFLKEHNFEAKLAALSEFPDKKQDDKGLIFLLLINRNIYNPEKTDFWVLVDIVELVKDERTGKLEAKETFRKYWHYKEDIVEFLGCENNNGNRFDPKKQYVVNRDKVGRPRRVLTDEEKATIRNLREQGMSINKIAQQLRIKNRLVMEFCRELS